MKRKWPTRILCIFLTLLICISWPMKAYAVGFEEVLILTRPDIALMILATFGVIYALASGPALFDSLEDALKAAPRFNQEDFEYWLAEAEAGLIRLADAPQWIIDTVKSWAEGFVSGTSYYSAPMIGLDGRPLYNTGDTIPAGVPVYFTFNETQYCVFDSPVVKVAWYRMKTESGSGLLYFDIFEGFMSASAFTGALYAGSTVVSKISEDWLDEEDFPDNNMPLYTMSTTFRVTPGSIQHRDVLARLGAHFQIDFNAPVAWNTWYHTALAGGYDTTVIAPHFPEVIIGGVPHALKAGYDMTTITVPNLHLPPIHYPGATTADQELEILLERLILGELTWAEYLEQVGIYNPLYGTGKLTVQIHNEELGYAERFELLENGVAGDPIGGIPVVAGGDYTLDLREFFPFCIPFDLYEFLRLLAAEPRAPVFNWTIAVPQLGVNFPVNIDLSSWDEVAELFRKLELMAFIFGLAMVTRQKILRG